MDEIVGYASRSSNAQGASGRDAQAQLPHERNKQFDGDAHSQVVADADEVCACVYAD